MNLLKLLNNIYLRWISRVSVVREDRIDQVHLVFYSLRSSELESLALLGVPGEGKRLELG